jgi:hypothetical protein
MIVQLLMASLLAGLMLFQIALISPNVAPNAVSAAGDLLPAQLGDWRAPSGSAPEKFSAAQVNVFATGADSAALNEFGFFGAQRRTYQRGNRTITVEAIRMKDSSAAYGAYTWYRQAGWREEFSVPHDPRSFQAAIGPEEAVLQRNGYCLRILGAQPNHKELARAAAVLPSMQDEPLPSLAEYLPAAGLVHCSAKYAYGPQVFEHAVAQVPPMAVGFHMGAETVSAEYRLPGKQPMTLLLVEYPTPQIARNFAKNLGSLNAGANPGANAGANPAENPAAMRIRRKGPLLMIVPNATVEADAEHLMDQVHYAMDGMWDEKTSIAKEPTFAQMIMSIFELCGILLLFCALSGVVYGGIRVLKRSKKPGHGFEGDIDFISLNLNS